MGCVTGVGNDDLYIAHCQYAYNYKMSVLGTELEQIIIKEKKTWEEISPQERLDVMGNMTVWDNPMYSYLVYESAKLGFVKAVKIVRTGVFEYDRKPITNFVVK